MVKTVGFLGVSARGKADDKNRFVCPTLARIVASREETKI